MPAIYCGSPCTLIKSVSVVLCWDLLHHRDTRRLVYRIHSEEIQEKICRFNIRCALYVSFSNMKVLLLDLQLEAIFSSNV